MHHERTRRDRIEVSGEGTAGAPADVVRARLRVMTEEDSVSSALGRAGETVRAVGQAARDAGLGDRDITTVSAGVQPRWDRAGKRVVGYTATHALTLVIRDLDHVNEVIEGITRAAGNTLSIDGLGLELSDPAPLTGLARERAFQDARAKAQHYATLAGRPLGPVLRIVEAGSGSGGAGYGGPMLRAMAAEASMPIEAGEQTVTCSVQVTFALGAASDSPSSE